jgi:replicative DNA helicase
MRAISCFTGLNKEQITEDVPMAREEWTKIKDNITMIDTVDWSMEDIDSHCEKHKPDIIVIDQLDKVNISGTFARTDEKLRAIYTSAREIAKRRECVVIAISQASADADNKDHISFSMMENSKTGKAAEADLIIGIGNRTSTDPTSITRILNVSKNKITGWHGSPPCVLNKYISRFED